MKSLKDLEYLDGACNGIGVVNGLVRAMSELRDNPDYTGTEYLNRHPVTKLYLYKLCDLAGIPAIDGYAETYEQFKEYIKKHYDDLENVEVINFESVGSGDYFGFMEKERYIDLEDARIYDCMECGACTYKCPAKIMKHMLNTNP